VKACAGSSPASGTKYYQVVRIVIGIQKYHFYRPIQ
jgi:hypothetical protein